MQKEADQERERRSAVYLRASIQTPDGSSEFRIRNLSAHGMCVDHAGQLSNGQWLPVMIGGESTYGMIVWATETLAGFNFDATINLDAAKRPVPAGTTGTPSIKSGWLSDRPDPYRFLNRTA